MKARAFFLSAAVLISLGAADPASQPAASDSAGVTKVTAPGGPSVILRPAKYMKLPGKSDCNSPLHWDGDTLYVFQSVAKATRSCGPDLLHLGPPQESINKQKIPGGAWIECTWKADDGTLYAWCHSEMMIAPDSPLATPRICAMRSTDNGATFEYLGVVLEARPNTVRPDAKNGYFAGGHGDFSVMLDHKQEFLYFFFSNYAGDVSEQGVAVARMKWSDRDDPAGHVFKWHKNEWNERGVGGYVTPIFPAAIDWARADADALWGPSIHWNSYLNQYIILLNRTKDKPGWPQEGIYYTWNADLSNPAGWAKPVKFYQTNNWYPEVIGTSKEKRETDKLAGKVARFFVAGESEHEIIFLRPGEQHP